MVSLLMMVTGLLTAAPAAAATIDDSKPAKGWRPNGGTAYAIARAGDTVFIGGSFSSMVSASGTTATRRNLAAVSASTGALLSWAPNPNGEVRALAVSPNGQTIYVGGTFTSIAGASRTNLAAVSASTGQATSFSANTNATVRTLVVTSGSVFVGGTFWQVRGTNRGGGAELDPTSGALKAWNPRTNYGIYALALAVDGSGVFIGGPFTTVSGSTHNRLAKVALGSGNRLSWTSGSSCNDTANPCHVFGLVATGSDLIIAMGGPGGRVVNLAASNGQQRWRTTTDGDIQTVVVDGTKIYAGGHFTDAVGGQPRAGLVAVNRSNGAVLSELNARVVGGSGVWSILKDGNVLRFGGNFTTIDGAAIGKYSSFPIV